ncbi:MAG: tRNA 2-thiouridine(34) synthase MnmA [Anaerolineales bacterium]
MTRRIAVAMSGGVDSSVAAARLVEAGEDIFGIMLRLWSGGPSGTNRCCSPADMARARQVAANLDILFYAQDVQDTFKALVVDFFIDGYQEGLTPNPCVECNRHIRWDFLLKRALALGATHLATGHYARVIKNDDRYELHRAIDHSKDQSYVLSVLGQHQLERAVFPLGEMTKDRVREYARQHDLVVADRADSQDLCFIGDVDYRDFLEHQQVKLPPPGPITNQEGDILGEHKGLAFYTIGQRKGIGIAAPHPLYVLAKDMENNRLIVGPREALGSRTFEVARVNWVGDRPDSPIEANVRIRYKTREVKCFITPHGDQAASVELETELPDITPGQAAVFYQNDNCLGGGIIQS